ncbi:MAG TPA: glycosyltransferase [Chitinophagaceae bacterium]|nr:glycosyltransferase [Chitinophagaceae bacterium]
MTYDPAVKKISKPRILVAPLDWGLGHATRCIPVIYELLKQNSEVWLAGEGAQEALLKKEFPDLPFLPLKGYRVNYGGSRIDLFRAVFSQLPQLFKTIKQENNWLKKAVDSYQFDAIVSDNRYGLYHTSVPSIFMTHQLMIKTPFGKWSELFLQKINYRFINRFTECWVPDEENENGFAGKLSHPVATPAIPVHYMGILSRLEKNNNAEQKNHLFISLSGPEPQRTLLENKIVNELGHYPGTATVVRGLPAATRLIPSTNDIRFYNHLPSEEFNREMEKAEYVISRSGYSTVMDVLTLGKKSILIPTPGQTEQEYLAKYLTEKQLAFCINQKDFSLKEVLQKVVTFKYSITPNIISRKLPLLINALLE